VLLLIVCAVALALMAGAHVLLARKYDRLLTGITARTEARDLALQKQAKQLARQAAQTDRAAAKTLDVARSAADKASEVHEDTASLQRHVNSMLNDPRLLRFLNREGGE
jgi:hypothetical protein